MSRIFVSVPNTWFLRRVLGIIRNILCAFLQMAFFLFQSPRLVTYPWALSRPSVVAGGGCCSRKARCEKLGEGGGWMGEFVQVCAKIFWGKTFIALSPILNPTPIMDPGSERELETELCGASGSTTLWPWLRSGS